MTLITLRWSPQRYFIPRAFCIKIKRGDNNLCSGMFAMKLIGELDVTRHDTPKKERMTLFWTSHSNVSGELCWKMCAYPRAHTSGLIEPIEGCVNETYHTLYKWKSGEKRHWQWVFTARQRTVRTKAEYVRKVYVNHISLRQERSASRLRSRTNGFIELLGKIMQFHSAPWLTSLAVSVSFF